MWAKTFSEFDLRLVAADVPDAGRETTGRTGRFSR